MSEYIASQIEEQRRGAGRQEALDRISREYEALSAAALPPLAMVQLIGSHDHAHFKSVGTELFRELAQRLRIDPAATVLDLGCGCGRMAIPFIRLLSEGRFHGADAWADGIAWCNDRLTGAGNADFHVNAVVNNYYFDDLDRAAHNDCGLPWIGDATVDAAYAISLFTHLTRADAAAYLKEIGRVLKEDGVAYLTFFVIDKFFWRHRERTGMHAAIEEREPGWFQGYRGQDFFGGFTMTLLASLLEAAKLRIIGYELGSWADKPGSRTYQDTLIVEPAR